MMTKMMMDGGDFCEFNSWTFVFFSLLSCAEQVLLQSSPHPAEPHWRSDGLPGPGEEPPHVPHLETRECLLIAGAPSAFLLEKPSDSNVLLPAAKLQRVAEGGEAQRRQQVAAVSDWLPDPLHPAQELQQNQKQALRNPEELQRSLRNPEEPWGTQRNLPLLAAHSFSPWFLILFYSIFYICFTFFRS